MERFQDFETLQGRFEIVVRTAVFIGACERKTFETVIGICKEVFDDSARLRAVRDVKLPILVVSESLQSLRILQNPTKVDGFQSATLEVNLCDRRGGKSEMVRKPKVIEKIRFE